ncbi:MAG: hypothetical protein PWR13_1265 [Archaeoglobi archaeon]|nr:hypothetical protein [Archaeoglobi archaeon]
MKATVPTAEPREPMLPLRPIAVPLSLSPVESATIEIAVKLFVIETRTIDAPVESV